MVKRGWVTLLAAALILLPGCNPSVELPDEAQEQPAQTAKEEQAYVPQKLSRELTPLEKELMKPPGKYSGKNFDEEKVKQELDKLPDNLTAEQYMEKFLQLMREDYRPHVTTFVNFDPNIRVNHDKPSENFTLPKDKRIHFSILLDASGSMYGKIQGKTKMESAKEAIQEFVSKVPKNATVSLRVYGHKGSNTQKDKAVSCASTEVVYNGTGYQEAMFKQALAKINPSGWTPIAKALRSVKQDVNPETTETIVYVVSDGIETCGGDPVAEAHSLSQSNIKTVVNIIGFDVDNEGQKMLKQVADAGNGEFKSVEDEQSLKQHLRQSYEELQDEWIEWKEQGQREAIAIKEEKQKLAVDTKKAIQKLAQQEREHLEFAQKYLKDKWGYEHPVDDTYDLIVKRRWDIDDYAVDIGWKLHDQATSSGWNEHDRITDEGWEGYDEATRKKWEQ
ncbi:MAG: VWA domain-containing protein [Thermoactinomyces sp.]